MLTMLRPAALAAIASFATPAFAQQPMPPEQQAEVALLAARKTYNDGNLPAASQQFQQLLQKFPNVPQANAARFGLGLCYLNLPEQDFVKAIEVLTPPANDGGFVERGPALYQLAVCQRSLGLKELAKPANNPNEVTQRTQAANQRFTQASQSFNTARDWYAGKKNDDWQSRCRCDVAEMELRMNKVKEARNTCEPFAKDPALAKAKFRTLGLYYHGLACFLDRDYLTAGRSLNQVAPFTDPAYGMHARYLVGRVLQLNAENAEASVHYDGVIADYEKAKKDAVQTLTQPDKFKNNPFEKARLEDLAKGPIPEYVAAATFHAASLNYEGGKFAEALAKFQAFATAFPTSPLQPDAALRVGFCLVQLKQFDEAAKVLAPLEAKTPRLADQSLFWLGKAQLGLAAAADPNNVADRDAKVRVALDTLRKSVDRAAQQAQQNDAEAKARRPEMLFEYADAMQSAKMFKEAGAIYDQLWNEQALMTRRDELLQRMTAAWGGAAEYDRSNQRGEEFRKMFPQSVLAPAVLFRIAENSFAKAVDLAKVKGTKPDLIKQKYDDAASKYKDLADKYPEFERVNFARFAAGVCYAQLGDLDSAVKALDAIPAPERNGDLAQANYLLADCLIRQAPSKADDALQENQMREKLTAAQQLLEAFLASSPKSAEAPAALLKLGHCRKRLGATLADPAARNQTLTTAREAFEKLAKEYPKDPLAGQGLLERAKVVALMGDRGGAMNDLRQFSTNEQLKQSPAAPLAALHLATLHREQNQAAESVKVLAETRQRYEGALAADPERADWALLLKYHHGIALFETAKITEAHVLFEEVLKVALAKPIGMEASLRSSQCRLAEARGVIETSIQARNQAGNDKAKIDAANVRIQRGRAMLVEAADQLVRRGEVFRAAFPTADARARMFYDAAWAWRWLADEEVQLARVELRKQAHAKLVAEAIKKLPPNSPPPNVPMPEIERSKVPVQSHEQRAYDAYKRAIDEFAESASSVDAGFELAELHADRANHDEAIKLLKAALDKEPSDKPVTLDTSERIRLRLGASLFAKKEFAAAASQFDAVAGNPKSPYLGQAMYRSGESHFAQGDFAKATEKLAVFRDKQEFHNRDGISDRAMLCLGRSLAGAKQWDPSRQAFEVLLQRFGPNNPFAAEARYGIAWAMQNQGKFDEAIASYQQVIAATVAEVAARSQIQIGLCKLAQKKNGEAVAAFLAVPAAYNYPELGFAATLEAARAYVADGKPAEADKLLQKVLSDSPKDSEWAKAAQERLKELKK